MPYLFSRQARLGPGNIADAMGWATRITEKVNAVTELDVSLWSTVFSPALGTLSWVAIVEDLAQLEAADGKLMVDGAYLDLLDEGAKYSNGQLADDSLVNLIYMDPGAADSNPTYVSVVDAVLTPGAYVRGIELGVEIAQRASKISGQPVSFGAAQTGVYGGVAWVAGYDSVEQLQAAGEALAADASFSKLLDDEASKAYQAGATTQTVHRKVA